MKVTLRADSVEIEGYVNAVGRDSRRMTDEYGNQFVEQMQPGVFALALSKQTEPIQMLHNHNNARVIGSTDDNLELEEDSIGLHARATVTDAQIIELARADKLAGWSFGFRTLDNRTSYDFDNHVERSVVTELELVEVSLIDDTMLPVYAGTSVHARAQKPDEVLTRAMDNDVVRVHDSTKDNETIARRSGEEEIDYSKYDDVIKALKGAQK